MKGINSLPKATDPLEFVKNNRRMFVGDAPIGPHLVMQTVGTLLWSGSFKISVESAQEWWLIESDQDWLLSETGKPQLDRFSKIIPFPAAGQNCHRFEILLMAFCDSIVSTGSDGVIWIKGNGNLSMMPPSMRGILAQRPSGRVIAFRIAGET